MATANTRGKNGAEYRIQYNNPKLGGADSPLSNILNPSPLAKRGQQMPVRFPRKKERSGQKPSGQITHHSNHKHIDRLSEL